MQKHEHVSNKALQVQGYSPQRHGFFKRMVYDVEYHGGC